MKIDFKEINAYAKLHGTDDSLFEYYYNKLAGMFAMYSFTYANLYKVDMEDMKAYARICLLQAMRDWDPTGKSEFVSWVWLYMRKLGSKYYVTSMCQDTDATTIAADMSALPGEEGELEDYIFVDKVNKDASDIVHNSMLISEVFKVANDKEEEILKELVQLANGDKVLQTGRDFSRKALADHFHMHHQEFARVMGSLANKVCRAKKIKDNCAI